jgi:hypothetical protein
LEGGIGGKKGTHGRAGQGGSGGRGGDSWARYNPGTETVVHRNTGSHGRSGYTGWSPNTRLSNGRDGKPGTSTICVVNADGPAHSYPSRYLLKVVNYDVVDENEDGINEPGEHLIIRNLIVLNYGNFTYSLMPYERRITILGFMPSPKRNAITMSVVDDGKWLQPVQSLQLPKGTLPGQSVRLDGEIKVLIRANNAPLTSGRRFHVPAVAVKLRVTFERLPRDLPEFQEDQRTVKTVQLRYPIELHAPQTLASVMRGDSFKITWVVSMFWCIRDFC